MDGDSGSTWMPSNLMHLRMMNEAKKSTTRQNDGKLTIQSIDIEEILMWLQDGETGRKKMMV